MTQDKEKKKQTKKYLRALTSESKHPIRHTRRVLKYGFSGFARNIWLSLASILVMTITLTILVVTLVSNIILNETANSLKNKIDITVFFEPTVANAELDEISAILATDPNVKIDSIITNDSELEVKQYLKDNEENEDMVKMITEDQEMYDIFVKNMPATLRFKVYDTENMDSVKELIRTDEYISQRLHKDIEKYSPTYDMNQTEIATINAWARIAKNGGIILGVIFLFISILVIFNTIRMAIFSRREEIYMMKLIGSSKQFIQGPFVVEAAISGIISGAITTIISYFGLELLIPKLANYGIDTTKLYFTIYQDSGSLVLIVLIIIATGALIGTIAAKIAAKKYLRKL